MTATVSWPTSTPLASFTATAPSAWSAPFARSASRLTAATPRSFSPPLASTAYTYSWISESSSLSDCSAAASAACSDEPAAPAAKACLKPSVALPLDTAAAFERSGSSASPGISTSSSTDFGGAASAASESESFVACTVISAAAAFFLPSFGRVFRDLRRCSQQRR